MEILVGTRASKLDPYHRRMLSNRILENIPYDEWILASEIASKIGERSIDVACIIKRKFLNKEVERKLLKNKQASPYLYRRLKRLRLRKNKKEMKISIS